MFYIYQHRYYCIHYKGTILGGVVCMRRIAIILVIVILCATPRTFLDAEDNEKLERCRSPLILEDFDPLVDLRVTVTITQIRTLEAPALTVGQIDKIDLLSDPDFYVKVFINDEKFMSPEWPTWKDAKYVYDPQWSATANVPDDVEWVNITIQLWDAGSLEDRLCDISDNWGDTTEKYDASLIYNIKTGHWDTDDWLDMYSLDPSGYGRLNGCDDNSYEENRRDCELWFDITQTDFDHDGIPYWTETEIFHTDPTVDDRGRDDDGDGVPIEWEYRWGHLFDWQYDEEQDEWLPTPIWHYHPFIWDDHANLDPDFDGLTNQEEYLTAQWGSDPFRKDLFVELDQMEAGPHGEEASVFPGEAKELLRTAYNKHNIVFHLDDGSWDSSGSETIPFDNETDFQFNAPQCELEQIYNTYFLHHDPTNWRRGVFHYGVLVYQCCFANGNAFGNNRYQISSKGLNEKAASLPWLDRDIVYASAYMHECGHTLGIFYYNTPGCDDENGKYPWQLNWWRWRPYKSVMNYGYMYLMVDYSDGSRGENDFDDWHTIDLTLFEKDYW